MKRDSQIFDLIAAERNRQMHGIELIASENFVSDQVMEAMGSVLTNKYAEGYPGSALLRRLPGRGQGRERLRHRAASAVSTARSTPTCSPTRAHRPTWPSSSPACSRATPFMGHEPGTRRPPDARFARQLLGQVLYNVPWATASTRQRAVSTTTTWRAMALECKPKLIVGRRERPIPRNGICKRMREIADEVGAYADGGHGPHGRVLIAAGLLENPVEIRAHRHLDDPQDPARPARRHHPDGQGLREPLGPDHAEGRREDDVADPQFGRLPRHRRAVRWSTSSPPRPSPSVEAVGTRLQGVSDAGAEERRSHGRRLRRARATRSSRAARTTT